MDLVKHTNMLIFQMSFLCLATAQSEKSEMF